MLDVRRQNDHDADKVKLPGAEWKDPDQPADWSAKLPREKEVVIYCARGGSVSNALLDALLGNGFKERFTEGGIEGWKGAGGAGESKKQNQRRSAGTAAQAAGQFSTSTSRAR